MNLRLILQLAGKVLLLLGLLMLAPVLVAVVERDGERCGK